MRRCLPQCVAGLLLVGAASTFAQTPPPNDDFSNRTVLTGNPATFTGSLEDATVDPGEPAATSPSDSYGYWPYSYSAQRQNASAWWSWTAGNSDPVTVEVLNASTNVFKLGAIDVWTGTNWTSDFTFVAGIRLDIGRHPFLTFSATAGTTYQLRVIGTNDGNFTLKITQTNRPIIVIQPFNRTVSVGGSVFFGVAAAGNPPFASSFSYQWRSNGVALPGETYPIFGLDNLKTNQSAAYSVVVSNALYGTVSDVSLLNVTNVAKPPHLISTGSAGGQFSFGISGDPGRLYRIQSSTNLVNWQEEKSFPQDFIFYNTGSSRERNGLVFNNHNSFSVSQPTQQRFYRTLNYVPPLAACINNLGKIRFAKELWSLETKHFGGTTPASSDITPYLKTGTLYCPLDLAQNFQTSYLINQVSQNPQCQISTNHILEEPEY